MDIVIDYIPNKKQSLFHQSDATECVYGGAKGGGKSKGLIMDAMSYALEYPDAEMYLFRESYPQLQDTLIPEWKDSVPSQLYTWKEKATQAELINGSIVKFRYVKCLKDAKEYQGYSMDYIGVDEMGKHDEETIQELQSCMRSVKGYPVRFRGTCNPGGKGHAHVKKKYVTGTNYGKKKIKDIKTGNIIEFIPATVYDNDALMKNDPNYVKRLENLPYEQKMAFLYGDWDVFEGMALENWDENATVIEDFEIPKHWRRWISADNGFNDPFAWYWLAVDEQGTVYVYREYTRNYEDAKVIYSKQAEKVLELSSYTSKEALEQYKNYVDYNMIEDENVDFDATTFEKIDFICIGHDAWQKHPATRTFDTPDGKSILDYYNDAGLNKLAGFIKPITDRKLRKATWLEYLEPYEGPDGELTSKVKIFKSCKKLIETLPLQINDEKDPEKVADSEIDHWYDAAGYGLIAYHVPKSAKNKDDMTDVEKHKQRLANENKVRKRRLM